jgi:hypothetical protein
MDDDDPRDERGARPAREAGGPFEGYVLGAIDFPARVRNLSLDGCLVEMSFGAITRQDVTLQIDLPVDGWTVVQCELVHAAGRHAFVKFVRMSDETRRRIEQAIDRLFDRPPDDETPGINGEADDD